MSSSFSLYESFLRPLLFRLSPDASHALALVALRRAGYRSDNRYLVFQTLAHTIGMPAEKWRILAKAHERRNLAEYEGHMEHDDRLLTELTAAATNCAMPLS